MYSGSLEHGSHRGTGFGAPLRRKTALPGRDPAAPLALGGWRISVAYVFVHILPDLTEQQGTLREAADESLAFLEYHIYLVPLVGPGVFYGHERAAKASRRRRRDRSQHDSAGAGVFWLHTASFALYNALIGYLLLHREDPGLQSLLLYAFAMAVHFVVNDHGLREDHKEVYHRVGRWVLAAAVFLGLSLSEPGLTPWSCCWRFEAGSGSQVPGAEKLRTRG